MTTVKPSAEIIADIAFMQSNLAKINPTIEIIGKPAIAKAEEITKALAIANEQLATVLADEAEAERKARLAGYGDVAVTVSYPPNYEGNLLRAGFAVEYTRLEWDNRARATVPKPHKIIGFRGLPGEVLEYLIEVRPDAIPAEIMALAPDKPYEAFQRYFISMRKGRIDAPAASPARQRAA